MFPPPKGSWNSMREFAFFLSRGWKLVWKQDLVWFLSALPLLHDMFSAYFHFPQEVDLIGQFVHLLLSTLLWLISLISVPYLLYRYAIGKPATANEMLSAVRRFAIRVIGCSCLGALLLAPLLLIGAGLSLDQSMDPPGLSNLYFLLLLPLAVGSGMYEFTLFEFFANDSSLRQAVSESWTLFKKNFVMLTALGIGLMFVSRIILSVSGMLTLLFQSGFDLTTLRTLNYINPSASLDENSIFLVISGLGTAIFTIWSASVFVLAYLKYSGQGSDWLQEPAN